MRNPFHGIFLKRVGLCQVSATAFMEESVVHKQINCNFNNSDDFYKMVILSYEFALVFVVFFAVYWMCRRSVELQNSLLIGAGLILMYTWGQWFLVSLLGTWYVTQYTALKLQSIHVQDFKAYQDNPLNSYHTNQQLSLQNLQTEAKRKKVLFLALALLLIHLCFFKYYNFVVEQSNEIGGSFTPLDIVMPIGLSFYTFQAISYLVDVYQRKMPAMPNSASIGFLAFVPTISAGPIFRAKDAIQQWTLSDRLGRELNYSKTQILDDLKRESENYKFLGLKRPTRRILMPYLAAALILFALAKKIVFASWLETLWVTPVFANPLQFNGLEVLTAIYAYALQLFFDFSGYTDLAIALGLLLGFRLPENFNRPYLATDIQDFWKRWHITLSTWIRDYLYIPLGGGRRAFWRVQLNLMLAFVLSGIWHGAGWNFFIWGAIHGIAMIWLNVMDKLGLRHKLTQFSKQLAIFITFNYVCFGWIFFHSKTFEQAIDMIKGLSNFSQAFSLPVFTTLFAIGLAWIIYPIMGNAREKVASLLKTMPLWLLPIVLSLYIVIIFAIAPSGLPGFIYANF